MKKIYAALMCFALGTALFAREATVSIGAGKNWKEKTAAQCAVWLEDTNGNYVRTLYVTQRASRRNWLLAPKAGRPESLPVWYHAAKHESAKGAAATSDADAVTAATPKGGVAFTAEIGGGAYVIKAEFNTSFDYNDFYTKKISGVNGQPSVVYAGKIPQDAHGEIMLSLAGTGSENGSDGKIYTDVSKLTTAKTIVDKIIITVR